MKRIDWPSAGIGIILSLAAAAFVAGFLGREHLAMLLLGNAGTAVVVVIALYVFDVWCSDYVAAVLALATMVATSVVLAWRTNEVCPFGVDVVGVVLVAEINILLQGLIMYCFLRFLDWQYRLSVRPSQPRQPREPQPLDGWWITVLVSVVVGALSLLCPQSAVCKAFLLGEACGGVGALLFLWAVGRSLRAGAVVAVLWLASFSLAMAASGLGWWTLLFTTVAVGFVGSVALAHVMVACNRDRQFCQLLNGDDY
jgi:hypothetical protein